MVLHLDIEGGLENFLPEKKTHLETIGFIQRLQSQIKGRFYKISKAGQFGALCSIIILLGTLCLICEKELKKPVPWCLWSCNSLRTEFWQENDHDSMCKCIFDWWWACRWFGSSCLCWQFFWLYPRHGPCYESQEGGNINQLNVWTNICLTVKHRGDFPEIKVWFSGFPNHNCWIDTFSPGPNQHLTIQCRLAAMRRTSHPTDIDPPRGPVRQWRGGPAATCGTGSWRGAWQRWQMHFWIRRHIPKPWKVCGLKLQIYGIVSSNIWKTERWNMKDIRTQKVEIKSRLRQIRNHP